MKKPRVRFNDKTLLARIRAKADRLLSRPDLVRISVHQGRVTLAGTAARREEEHLIARILSLRGVVLLRNELQVVENARFLTGVAPLPSPTDGLERLSWTQWGGLLLSASLGVWAIRKLALRKT